MSDHENESGLTRGQLSRATGCNIETIRYYEKIGLMPDPPRTGSGYRVYPEGHITRLRFILRARELGFAMGDIRGLLGLSDGNAPTCMDVRTRTERHLADVRSKIDDLKQIEAVLAETVARCSGDQIPECAVLRALTGN